MADSQITPSASLSVVEATLNPSDATPTSPQHPTHHTSVILAVIGAFLVAVAALSVITMCLHLFRRKQRTRRDTANAETMTEMNYYVQFTGNNITAGTDGPATPVSPPEAQPHQRPSTLPLHGHRGKPSSSSAVKREGLLSSDYEALLPASVEVQEPEPMYEPMCSSASGDSEDFYHEPTPIRIQMVIANAEAAAMSATLDGQNIPVELHPAREVRQVPPNGEERVYENIVIGRKTNPDELYI